MTSLCHARKHARKSDGRRLVRALAFFIIAFPAVAQPPKVSSPLNADEVMARVVEMNEVRAKALESYSSVRSYHLECHCVAHKKADMVVRTDYQAPNKKEFSIVSESGSGTVRERVFKKLLEAEQESMRDENQQRSAITPENYTFQLSDYKKTDTDEFYVLDAQPRNKNKFLFRGHIWVNAKDFAITRVEGEPAVNPSWWTVKTDFKRRYQKIGDFWLPESNESETKVRVLGTAVLSIEYRDYQITRAAGATVASPPSEALAATVAEVF
jgi:outer membrane lipoprotein-sorting protein